MSDRREAALGRLLESIRPAAAAAAEDVRAHLGELTKPPGSLGRIEELALRIALIYGDPPPRLLRRVVFVLAADHGVAARGVSAYPPQVTAQMCELFARGGAAISAIAGSVGAEVVPVDVGVAAEGDAVPGLLRRKVRAGTRDLSTGAALTRAETIEAILVGASLVRERSNGGELIGLGDMGIGNSTAAAAVTGALTGRSAREVVGPGTGVAGARLERKRTIVARALERCGDRRDPIQVLCEVGGLEIAGLTGVTLGAAAAGRAVVTDGFIATAGALAAVRLVPSAGDYLFASHLSPEPGHAVQLAELGMTPLLDLGMRLGEGTGAALAMPTLAAAAAVLREMATFESAGVAGGPDRPTGRPMEPRSCD